VSRNAYLAGGRDDARAGGGRDAAGDGALLVPPQPPGLPLRRCLRRRPRDHRRRFSLRHGCAWLVRSRSLFPLSPSPPKLNPLERGCRERSTDRAMGNWTVQIPPVWVQFPSGSSRPGPMRFSFDNNFGGAFI
jgi:hypothetical protein